MCFEILEDFRWTSDVADIAAWHEYGTATKGHQGHHVVEGPAGVLGTDDDCTDGERAAEQIGGDDIALIAGESWAMVTDVPGLAMVLPEEARTRRARRGERDVGARHGIPLALRPREGT